MMSRTSVLLADDHRVLLDCLVRLLQKDFNVLGTARDGRELIELAMAKRPDVIIMDIAMPSLNGIDAVRTLRTERCSSKVLFLTMHDDLSVIEEALRAGGSGLVLKVCDATELVRAIHSVAKGTTYITPLLVGDLVTSLMNVKHSKSTSETHLTRRQREVLQLIAEGKTMKETGTLMGISTRAAETHKYEVMRLLGVKTTAALIRYALRIKLV
jgi:DNA-binding NarL/FixJ family response regulator